MITCLVTGGAGFLGAHVVKYLLEKTDWNILIWDKFTYASSGGKRLIPFQDNPRVMIETKDVSLVLFASPQFNVEYIVHLAAETHVDRSIDDPDPFIVSNIEGTYSMLEYARRLPNLKKFLQFSTDEVFGSSGDGDEVFWEWSRYRSSNPYAATKAAAEELALAWQNTYKLPVVISHCSNIFGEDQHEEKFIPKLIRLIGSGEEVPIHVNEEDIPGQRMYVYAGDVAQAIRLLLEKGEIGQKYNIPGISYSNEQIANTVAHLMKRIWHPKRITPYKERPGWDFSYQIIGEKIKDLGWEPGNFLEQLEKVVIAECQ